MTRLVYTATLRAPIGACFDLVRDIDVHCATAAAISARAVGGRQTGRSEWGDETRWSARFFGIAFELTTRITKFERPIFFEDNLVRGPFRVFRHRYTFRESGATETFFEDEFVFESAVATADRLLIRASLEAALFARGEGIRRLAGQLGSAQDS